MHKMVVFVFSCMFLCLALCVSHAGDVLSDRAEATVIPYTLADRERMVRMETKLEAVDKRLDSMDKRLDSMDKRLDSMDKRLDGVDKRIDSLQSILLGGFGVLFSGMMALIGFVLWDRRAAIAPAIRKNRELEEDVAALRNRMRELEEWKTKLALALQDSSKEDASRLAHILTTLF